jgi:ATP-dependent DNA helicase RecG
MVREAIARLDRTLPLAARFPKGSVFREDRQPVPPEALRETIINAVTHRDLSLASGYVAIAVFDDRIEVRSVGELPFGLRAEQLSEEHPSRPRNPDLAGAVHRTGAIEVWGRGTNRVIEACRAWGIEPPTFRVDMGVTTVTFTADILPGGLSARDGEVLSQAVPSSSQAVLSPSQAALLAGATEPKTLAELMAIAGHSNRTRFRDEVLAPLLRSGLLAMTVPDKPRSPNQRYRLTDAGKTLRARRDADR